MKQPRETVSAKMIPINEPPYFLTHQFVFLIILKKIFIFKTSPEQQRICNGDIQNNLEKKVKTNIIWQQNNGCEKSEIFFLLVLYKNNQNQ